MHGTKGQPVDGDLKEYSECLSTKEEDISNNLKMIAKYYHGLYNNIK